MSDGVALSHSHDVECTLGSRIQSHWPCMTLWPISMFSRILATDRPTVPASQAGGKSEKSSTARLPSSILRWASMTLRMYAASRSPRLASTCSRIASSSRPSCSMSSAVRWAMGLCAFFWMAVMSVSSELDVAGAGGGVDAGLDADSVALGGGGDGAVAQVAYGTRAQRHDAAEADPHPAAGRHEHAGCLAGGQQRGGAVGVDRDGLDAEADRAALAGDEDRGAEALGVQVVEDPGGGEVLLQ